MELKEELESTRKRQQDIVQQINQLEEQKQQLLSKPSIKMYFRRLQIFLPQRLMINP